MKYFDAHCHIQFPMYDEDRTELLEKMEEAEVGGIIVGVDRESSTNAVLLSDGETLFASIGLHPNDKPAEGYDDLFYRTLAKDPRVVAIGECGLDYYRPEDPESEKARQKEVFAAHLRLAGQTGKPLMIHARPSKGSMDAYLDAYAMIVEAKKEFPNLKGDMHFFVGDAETAKKFVDIDFTLSYTAVLTFTHDYDEVIRSIPLSHLITETDSPYVAPKANRGKRNDPLAVRDVVTAIAAIRSEDEDVIREALLANAKRLFRV